MENMFEILKSALPALAALIGWFIINPDKQEKRINKTKDLLRTSLRFKVSYELAHLMPLKIGKNSLEEAFGQYQNDITGYLASPTNILSDYIKSKALSEYAVHSLRVFKYMALFLPLLGFICFYIIVYLCKNYINNFSYFIIIILLIISIYIPVIVMERNKDKLNDLMHKYEISENE